MESEGLLL